jgi:hypothetical protein
MQSSRKKAVSVVSAALAASALLPAAGGAKTAGGGCVAPDVVGVSLAKARKALGASGCGVRVRQLPAHGSFVTPASPDGRQLVGRQSPSGGGQARAVTVWVEPLCSQPAQPGPDRRSQETKRGPAELIAGLYVEGGPALTSPHCRRGRTQAGTVTISTPDGSAIASRQVLGGHFAIFPLAPGHYVLGATLAGAGRASLPQMAFFIAPRRTTRLNLVANVP